MNLRRQLLLVSLLTLILPWAGCEFIQETERALRVGQQQMLAGTGAAIAESLQQYADAFPASTKTEDFAVGNRLYAHALPDAPVIDGYLQDWPLSRGSLQSITGADGDIRYVLGQFGSRLYLFVHVTDRQIIYGQPQANRRTPPFADGITLISVIPGRLNERIEFFTEAPGVVMAWRRSGKGLERAASIRAVWQDVAGGYQLEAQIPRSMLGTHLGLVVDNTAAADTPPTRSASFAARLPGRLAGVDRTLQRTLDGLEQPGLRLTLTDRDGWRIAASGELATRSRQDTSPVATWLRLAYDALVEPGIDAELAEPHPTGREQQDYIRRALDGEQSAAWFRSPVSGAAVVAVAAPIGSNGETIGSVVLQQGTDEILSLRNEGLARLLNVTLIATVGVALVLLGYASWLSRRIRRLSVAADAAMDDIKLPASLPSAEDGDEIGDLSRSFANALTRLGNYNNYLRTLASRLSHELRTPLAIVTSSLDNLEHESLGESAANYTARAKDGAERLRTILNAMSEATRVEELMQNVETERVDLAAVLEQTTAAYADLYDKRRIRFDNRAGPTPCLLSPELIVQMLDKLIDNAVSFSADGDPIVIGLKRDNGRVIISVENPGPPLPDTLGDRLFDSMVSVREGDDDRHLGLGLYIARLIAEGHGGQIRALNTASGVMFEASLPGG